MSHIPRSQVKLGNEGFGEGRVFRWIGRSARDVILRGFAAHLFGIARRSARSTYFQTPSFSHSAVNRSMSVVTV